MKVLIAIMTMLTILTMLIVTGCWSRSSDKGGIAPIDEEFSITVPRSSTIKQGETAAVAVTLNRGAYFKQDVQLKINADGIKIMPASILVKSDDQPITNIKIVTATDTAIGEYQVTVTGTPPVGRPASTTFTVEVVNK